MEKQLELNAVPRKRVRLEVPGEPVEVAGSEQGSDMTVDVEAFIGLTDWFHVVPPPCDGFWDFERTDSDLEAPAPLRCWFDVKLNQWKYEHGDGIIRYLDHTPREAMVIRWRGLKAPWPHGYDYPVPGGQLNLPLARQRARVEIEKFEESQTSGLTKSVTVGRRRLIVEA